MSCRRLKVNDVVHSFTYICRHSELPPFLLLGEDADYKTHYPSKNLQRHPSILYQFQLFASSRGGTIDRWHSAMAFLIRHTWDWNNEEWVYAIYLMEKYYNV